MITQQPPSRISKSQDSDLWSRFAQFGVCFANPPEQMKATHLRSTIRGILAVKKRYWRDQMSCPLGCGCGASGSCCAFHRGWR